MISTSTLATRRMAQEQAQRMRKHQNKIPILWTGRFMEHCRRYQCSNNGLRKSLIVLLLLIAASAGTYYCTLPNHSYTISSSLPSSFLNEHLQNIYNDLYRQRKLLESQPPHSSSSEYDAYPSLFPFTWKDFWGYLSASCGLMIAAGGGIGGGGILVPIYILVMEITPKHAIPLSNITVFGGAIANTMLNVRKRHPLADRPLVDWDLILVMEPLTIAGALIGALLNKVLPEAFLVVMLVLLLSITAYNTLKKAKKMYKKESVEYSEIVHTEEIIYTDEVLYDDDNTLWMVVGGPVDDYLDDDVDDDEEDDDNDGENNGEVEACGRSKRVNWFGESIISGENVVYEDIPRLKQNDTLRNNSTLEDDEISMDTINDDEMNGESDHGGRDNEGYGPINPFREGLEEAKTASRKKLLLEEILAEEQHAPVYNIAILVLLFVVVLLINILKGGGAFPSPIGIKCGSIAFWFAEILTLGWILGVCYNVRRKLVERAHDKQVADYQYQEGDIVWNSRSTIIYPAFCGMAGFFAGMFGVGGGIVKGPLMLAMGVHPAVASATSACMILFTSSTATTSFMVFGLLLPDYAALSMFVGFSSTLLGQTIMTILLRKYKRNSYIAFSIGFVVLLSAIFMTVESVHSMRHGGVRERGSLCEAGE